MAKIRPLSEWLRAQGACKDACTYADVHGYVRGDLKKAIDELPDKLVRPCIVRMSNCDCGSIAPKETWTAWLRIRFRTIGNAIKAEKEAPL